MSSTTGPDGTNPAAETMCCRPIGYVSCACPDDQIARRRRELVSTINILPEFMPALLGIEDYSHLFVLFWLDRAAAPSVTTYHPRGNPEYPLTGVLASRGRNHPNPIGLAVVELVSRSGDALTVRRLDAFDRTPIIDIKPYDDYDRVNNPQVPAWFRQRSGISE